MILLLLLCVPPLSSKVSGDKYQDYTTKSSQHYILVKDSAANEKRSFRLQGPLVFILIKVTCIKSLLQVSSASCITIHFIFIIILLESKISAFHFTEQEIKITKRRYLDHLYYLIQKQPLNPGNLSKDGFSQRWVLFMV